MVSDEQGGHHRAGGDLKRIYYKGQKLDGQKDGNANDLGILPERRLTGESKVAARQLIQARKGALDCVKIAACKGLFQRLLRLDQLPALLLPQAMQVTTPQPP